MADHDDALPELTLEDVMNYTPGAANDGDDGGAGAQSAVARDEAGRFAPKPDPVEDDPNPAPKPASGADDRYTALQSENAEIKRTLIALQQHLLGKQAPAAAKEEPAAPPEFWSDPNAAVDHRLTGALTPMQQQMQEMRLDVSDFMAQQQHGAEAVEAAKEAARQLAQQNPQLYRELDAHLGKSRHPVADLVSWHKRHAAISTVGDDPQKFVQTELARLAADPAGRAQLLEMLGQQQEGASPSAAPTASATPPAPRTALPISLSKAPTGKAPPVDSGDMSDGALFNEVTSRSFRPH